MAITSLAQLNSVVKNSILHELSRRDAGSVFGKVQETELKHIKEDVYGAYSPVVYARRYGASGMGDKSNIIGSNTATNLTIRNVTISSPSVRGSGSTAFLPEIIEYGLARNLWNSDPSSAWLNPRPFTENTISELSSSKLHIKAMKQGLAASGFIVK